jgi:hypothetical protein
MPNPPRSVRKLFECGKQSFLLRKFPKREAGEYVTYGYPHEVMDL